MEEGQEEGEHVIGSSGKLGCGKVGAARETSCWEWRADSEGQEWLCPDV